MRGRCDDNNISDFSSCVHPQSAPAKNRCCSRIRSSSVATIFLFELSSQALFFDFDKAAH
jgi:hypothetical protein